MDVITYAASLLGMCILLGVGSIIMPFIVSYLFGRRGEALGGATILGSWLFLLVMTANFILQM